MKRVVEQEWLDADQGTPKEIASSLRSIGRINRLFGGNRTHMLLLRAVQERTGLQRLRVLEVASGRGQVVAAAAHALRPKGLELEITLMDLNASHLPTAWPPELAAPGRIEGDALRIPLENESVDVIACCLFLHHLSEEQARTFFREALRVARVAVLINDLERTHVHALLATLASFVDPSRISRHDGPASVRQAYTAKELEALFAQTGKSWNVRRLFLYRLAGVLWKQSIAEMR